jgi:hypothetical protein
LCSLSQWISSWINVFTWKKLLVNGESKCKCFLKRIWNNDVYVKPCFVKPIESNVKRSNVILCEWCMVHVATSCIGNWIFVIMWEGLLPICISIIFFPIGVYFILIIQNYS